MPPLQILFPRGDPHKGILSPEAITNLLSLPESVLATIPALTPPPGTKSNFTNGDYIGNILIVITAFCIAITLMCVVIRLWTIFMIKTVRWSWSDLFFALAVVSSIGLFSISIFSTTGDGQVGHHQYDAPLSKVFMRRATIQSCVNPLLSSFSTIFIKVTIFITYVEIFPSVKWIRVACWIGGAITVAWSSAVILIIIILSFPHGKESFASHALSKQTFVMADLSVPISSVGLALDILLFLIPVVAVFRLKANRRKKIGLALIFGTGFLAILASVGNLISRKFLFRNGGDVTWNSVSVFTMNNLELAIGMIIACTWHIAKFLRTYEDRFCSMISRFCGCCTSRNQGKQKRSEKDSGGSDTVMIPKEIEKEKKPPKLYPGLDITEGTKGGSVTDNTLWDRCEDGVRENMDGKRG